MKLIEKIRSLVFRGLRIAFRAVPLDEAARDRGRRWFTRYFPALLPAGDRGPTEREFSARRDALRDPASRAIGYRARHPAALPTPLPVRSVAFYLPQFHPVPENDAAWGEGFTEWRNVGRALPRFEGHAQPRLPGELGEYDLRDGNVFHRQVELAREHGVSAFCFYFYWFNGRSPLERPLRQWLDDASLQFPFCLCWANESWTKRWDGREHEVILAQSHSDADDLAFIGHVAAYLRDPRYLRVDGRPMLVVYRPDLFPDPRRTAQAWREYCRGAGIGEIHLACVQAFDRRDPASIGFDAAIEFPPNMGTAEDVGVDQILRDPAFAGRIVDWRSIVRESLSKPPVPYLRYPGVNAGWDNEPRRQGRGLTYLHASPRRYRDWLSRTIAERCGTLPADQRLVFVNAWNEWAEGAVLEPDARLGHAWLDAHRQALLQADVRDASALAPARPCAVVHAWYPDVLVEILSALRDSGIAWRVVVTTAFERERMVRDALAASGFEAEVHVSGNRGRDVLPFLRVADALLDEGVDVVLKLHTKRSPHRSDGDDWRRDMVGKLLGADCAAGTLAMFGRDPRLGLVVPAGHVRRVRKEIGANAVAVRYLVSRLGLRKLSRGATFPAGSMYWVRLAALRPMLDANLDEWEFEPEREQLDATMAHAVERVMEAVVRDAGFDVGDTSAIR